MSTDIVRIICVILGFFLFYKICKSLLFKNITEYEKKVHAFGKPPWPLLG